MSAVGVTISDLGWSLQNNLTGFMGLDWTLNLWVSLLKRLGDQHALRDFGSSEFVSSKYAGNWGLRRGGILSLRGRVWTFQHLVWTTPFDLAELRTAHVFVPKETNPRTVPGLTQYGTVLLAEPLGTLDGKPIDIESAAENAPFLLAGSRMQLLPVGGFPAGLRGWTRVGGEALPVYPGSLVPHFPAGGLHLDFAGSSLSADDRHGGQLATELPRGSETMDVDTDEDWFSGEVRAGDPFTVEDDPETYTVLNTVAPVSTHVLGIVFRPPAGKDWDKGADVTFTNAPPTLTDDAGNHVGQLHAEGKATGTVLSLATKAKAFTRGPTFGDSFTVSGDPQVYTVRGAGASVGKPVKGVQFSPPSARKWSKGIDVEFRNPFTTPAPQDCRVTELEPGGVVLRATIERQGLMILSGTGLGVRAKELLYLVDAKGVGQKAEVVRAGEGPETTRVRFRGDAVPVLGRTAVKVRGISPTPAAEAAVALTRVDDHTLGVPSPSPPYAAGDVLVLTDAHLPKPLVTAVTALAATLEVDEALPDLASSGTVALLEPIAGEAARAAKLGDGGKVVDFKVDPAAAVGALPDRGKVLLVTGKGAGAARVPAIVKEKVDDHQVRLDRSVGAAGDEVTVATLGKKDDLGHDPKGSGTTLRYVPAKPASAPAADTFVLVDAGTKAARRVTGRTLDGLAVERIVPAAAVAPNATRFPARKSRLEGDARRIAPIWVLVAAGGAKLDKATKALALRGYTPMPPGAGAAVALAGANVAAKLVTVAAGAGAFPSDPALGALVRATVGGTTVLALVKQVQLAVTLDRALPAGVAAAGLELVPLAVAGPEYRASARDKLVLTLKPEITGLAGVQVEMPRLQKGELVQVGGGAPAVTRTYRVADVAGTTLTLDAASGDLPGPYPLDVTFQRLAAVDPRTGSTRSGRAGTIPAADRTKLVFDVWSPDGIVAPANVAVVDGGQAWPAVVSTVDELRMALVTDGVLADGAVTLDIPTSDFVAWSAAVTRDGDEVVLEDAVIAAAAAHHDVAVVPYAASARVVAGTLSSGTVKVPERLDDEYDLDRYEALIEHELHHTVQSASFGPLLLSLLPMWALEIVGDAASDAERTKFKDGWQIYSSIVEAISVGGVLDLLVGSVYGGLLWLTMAAIHGIRLLATDGDPPPFFLDPFALEYFPATVPDPAHADTITIPALASGTLALAVGDRVQLKKPSEGQPITFFSNRRTVKEVRGGGTVQLAGGDLPLEGNATAIAKVSAGADDPLHSADNALLRGLGLGWMGVLFDPYGELAFRVAPERGSAGDVVLRMLRYPFGTKSWGLVLFSGFAFWDNLRRQWGLGGHNPHLAIMERGASYASGDTYYPMGLLRGSGDEAVRLKNKQLVVGDVVESWFVQEGGDRREGTVIAAGQLAAPGVPLARMLAQMPFLDVPTPPKLGFRVNQGGQIDPAVTQSGLAVPDVFVEKVPFHFVEPSAPVRQFRAANRGMIPVSAAMERSAGMYVAFSRPGTVAAKTYKHRVTVVDDVGGGKSAREAFEARGIDLIHDLDVQDATVRIGGRKVAEGDELTLLPFERAQLEVTPGRARRWDVTVMRPADGDIRRVGGVRPGGGDVSLQASKTAAAEPAEVSRVHHYVDGKSFEAGGLMRHGVHVPADVHVPVRRFRVKVDTTLPVHPEPNPDDVTAGPFKPGQKAHVLVPVRLRPPKAGKPNPTLVVAFTAPAPAGITVPALTIDQAAVDPATDPRLKTMFAFGGRVLTIALAADAPPEAEVKVDVSADVGPDDANTETVKASFVVQPHFTLARKDGGADFKVAPKSAIELECSGGVQAGDVTLTPKHAIAATVTGSTVKVDVPDGTPAGAVRVLVADKDHTERRALRTITVG